MVSYLIALNSVHSVCFGSGCLFIFFFTASNVAGSLLVRNQIDCKVIPKHKAESEQALKAKDGERNVVGQKLDIIGWRGFIKNLENIHR